MNLKKIEFGSINWFVHLFIFLITMDVISCCGPGRSGGKLRLQKKLKPLVFKQHVPNYAEKTLGASGPGEGKITRSDPRFKHLVPNYNSDIIFKDEEGSGEDRLMTQRCKERLNTLAVSVMNLWPGIRLRVIESWDSESSHYPESLHYEGRAVDITTSDRDSSKYGMLARLAVEAGFDWVYYESRSHVHCSVKSETSQAAKSLGCFTGDTFVTLKTGERKSISQLQIGEQVLTLNSEGNLEFSEVLIFMHHSPHSSTTFLRLTTASGVNLTITPSHLILRWEKREYYLLHEAIPVYARDVQINDQLLLYSNDSSKSLYVDRVINIEVIHQTGVYAPLTVTGTIVVNDVVASCYAVIYSQRLAHIAFAPLRLYNSVTTSFNNFYSFLTHSVKSNTTSYRYIEPQDGIHWYCRFLQSIANFVVPRNFFLNE